LNLTAPGTQSVRAIAEQLSQLLGREVTFTGTESPTAWLNNPTRASELFGQPATSLETMLQWTAHWVKSEGRSLGKPTHFEVRDGKY